MTARTRCRHQGRARAQLVGIAVALAIGHRFAELVHLDHLPMLCIGQMRKPLAQFRLLSIHLSRISTRKRADHPRAAVLLFCERNVN